MKCEGGSTNIGNVLSDWYLRRLIASNAQVILSGGKNCKKPSPILQHLKMFNIDPDHLKNINNNNNNRNNNSNKTDDKNTDTNTNSFSWENFCQSCIHNEKKRCRNPHSFVSNNGLDHAVYMIQYDMQNLLSNILYFIEIQKQQQEHKQQEQESFISSWFNKKKQIQKQQVSSSLSSLPSSSSWVTDFELDEVAIHVRVGDILHYNSSAYGLIPNHVYDKYIPSNAKSIGIITQPFDLIRGISGNFGINNTNDAIKNEAIITSLQHHLKQLHPNATISIRNSSNEPMDVVYARLIGAKRVLFCGTSSFCLVAALGRKTAAVASSTSTSTTTTSDSSDINQNQNNNINNSTQFLQKTYIVKSGLYGTREGTLRKKNNDGDNSWLNLVPHIDYVKESIITSKEILNKTIEEIMKLIENPIAM